MKKFVTIKRRIKEKYNSEVGCYLFKSMYHRHRLYNLGIEFIKNNNEKFDLKTIHKYLYSMEVNNGWLDNTITGIRESVLKDLARCVSYTWRDRKQGKPSKIKFKPFNPNYNSFVFYCKRPARINFEFLNSHQISFRGKGYKYITVNLFESLYPRNNMYIFDETDVKTVGFIQKNKKLYITMRIKVKIKNKYKYDTRDNLAGIDLGIRNPATLFDGEKCVKVKFPDYKMKRMEKRLETLSKHLSNKEYRSKNYDKLLLKMNKIHEKMINIRLDWRNYVAYHIVNKYKTIIVDEFKHNFKSESKKRRHKANKRIQSRALYSFMITLRHMAEKYRTKYIVSNTGTTRTCSSCGYENEPITLDKKYLSCFNCGLKIDRDENAAINCYNQYVTN